MKRALLLLITAALLITACRGSAAPPDAASVEPPGGRSLYRRHRPATRADCRTQSHQSRDGCFGQRYPAGCRILRLLVTILPATGTRGSRVRD